MHQDEGRTGSPEQEGTLHTVNEPNKSPKLFVSTIPALYSITFVAKYISCWSQIVNKVCPMSASYKCIFKILANVFIQHSNDENVSLRVLL